MHLKPSGCETAPGAHIEVRGKAADPYFSGTQTKDGLPIEIAAPETTLDLILSPEPSEGERLHVLLVGQCKHPEGEAVHGAFYCRVPSP